MLNNEKISEILNACANEGYDVKVRDISYVLLCRFYADKTTAYKSVFSTRQDCSVNEINNYHKSKPISFLRTYIESIEPKDENYQSDISFEENKAYMLKLKADTEKAMAQNEIDKKDGLKILADLSVKLNDKFSVADNTKDQIVIVNTKFNAVCDCGKEIYIPTKEDLMKKYDLVERQ